VHAVEVIILRQQDERAQVVTRRSAVQGHHLGHGSKTSPEEG
jgi:hypothetical protein